MQFYFVLFSSTKNIFRAGSNTEKVGGGTLAFKRFGQKVPHTPLFRAVCWASHTAHTCQQRELGEEGGLLQWKRRQEFVGERSYWFCTPPTLKLVCAKNQAAPTPPLGCSALHDQDSGAPFLWWFHNYWHWARVWIHVFSQNDIQNGWGPWNINSTGQKL